MPRQVDPVERRKVVADALFRVVYRDGLQRASLRAVADEAGLNIGSLRHYFADQQELMRFAMREMMERVGNRLLRRLDEVGGLAGLAPQERQGLVLDLLGELLPLDEPRRAEVAVFIDFVTAARTNAAIDEELAHEAAAGTRAVVRRILLRMADTGALRPGRDIDIEAERLSSLVDGLALTAVLHPGILGPDACLNVLRTHLDDLICPGADGA
jgi:AcrR family transcriptional regulator